MSATWTAPRDYTAGEIITASILNTDHRDNISWLKTPTTSGRVQFAADFSSAAITSYTDITSVTTTMTTNGGGLDLIFRCQVANSTPVAVFFQVVIDGVASGFLCNHYNGTTTGSFFFAGEHIAALAAGSHTIKIQVKAASGTTVIKGTTAATNDPMFYVVERGA